jgi:hypothetical protein
LVPTALADAPHGAVVELGFEPLRLRFGGSRRSPRLPRHPRTVATARQSFVPRHSGPFPGTRAGTLRRVIAIFERPETWREPALPRVGLDREALSALCATSLEHLSSAQGLHPFAEAMRLLPAPAVRLKRPLHRNVPFRSCSRSSLASPSSQVKTTNPIRSASWPLSGATKWARRGFGHPQEQRFQGGAPAPAQRCASTDLPGLRN